MKKISEMSPRAINRLGNIIVAVSIVFLLVIAAIFEYTGVGAPVPANVSASSTINYTSPAALVPDAPDTLGYNMYVMSIDDIRGSVIEPVPDNSGRVYTGVRGDISRNWYWEIGTYSGPPGSSRSRYGPLVN